MKLFFLIFLAGSAHAASSASSRHWAVEVRGFECEAVESRLGIDLRIEYLGPKGPVEAPAVALADGKGSTFRPTGLVWKDGGKTLPELLAAGGIRNIQSDRGSRLELRFEPRGATGEIRLKFADIPPFALTTNRGSALENLCKVLLAPNRIRGPRPASPGRKAGLRVRRASYPCRAGRTLRIVEASQPPHAPEQMLVFGRGYLPAVTDVTLPTGKAPAQAYAYNGPNDLRSVEEAARQAIAADFPKYAAASYFAFNWGLQKAPSGNEMESIGIYGVGPCRD